VYMGIKTNSFVKYGNVMVKYSGQCFFMFADIHSSDQSIYTGKMAAFNK
jgi:hypothetical protein